MKINNFQGDLTDNSAKTEALYITRPSILVTTHELSQGTVLIPKCSSLINSQRPDSQAAQIGGHSSFVIS